MNENLTKILKNCPKGQRFYSTIYGDVEFIGYDKTVNAFVFNPINIINVDSIYIEEDGKYSFAGECILFPSKDQRGWSKFTAPWYKPEEEKSIKPKFKIGDWVVRGDTIAQILDIQEQYYIGLDINGKDFVSSRFLNDDKIHLWTIQDAKDGDILCCKSDWMCIFKSLNPNTNTFSSYCFMDSDKCFFNSGSECHTLDRKFVNAYNRVINPATKEQRDLLFQKIKEAGYKWNNETKTLEKLVEHKFDPKTLKPFDKVLAKDFDENSDWICNLFSHYNKKTDTFQYYCVGDPYTVCIPYNDDTKHLVGTTDEAPEFYRYWED